MRPETEEEKRKRKSRELQDERARRDRESSYYPTHDSSSYDSSPSDCGSSSDSGSCGE